MLVNRDWFQSLFRVTWTFSESSLKRTRVVMLYISVQCVAGIHCVGYARDWIAIIHDLPLWLLPKLINLKPTNNADATF